METKKGLTGKEKFAYGIGAVGKDNAFLGKRRVVAREANFGRETEFAVFITQFFLHHLQHLALAGLGEDVV